MALLEIKDLHARVGEKEILKGVNLCFEPGEVHAVMGPNGCGKSTLSAIIAGHPAFQITQGDILFKGQSILNQTPDIRANNGIFLAFQHPIELPGVGLAQFLKTALNAKRSFMGQPQLDAVQFMKHMNLRAKALGITPDMLKRPVNVGFSGGEKKRLETFQMAMLEPDFCILDEMDSGLDVDALKVVGQGLSVMREPHRSFMIITHHDDLLQYIQPDKVSIMRDGQIVITGGADFVHQVEEQGYDHF